MKRYRVILNGQNFMMGDGEAFGFFTTRWVKAENAESAEQAAVELIKNDPELKGAVVNEKDNPPMIYLEALSEIGWLEYFRKNPGGGYTFYPASDDEPANQTIKSDEGS